MKKIYVLLSRTNTIPARIIRRVKRSDYSHSSISLAPDSDCFFSYARRKIKNPLRAGLVFENPHTETFAKYPDAPCALYEIPVSDEGFSRIEFTLSYYLSNYSKAKYNIIGLFAIAFGIRLKRKLRLLCSQFVAILLKSSLEIELPKDPYLMCPDDFTRLKGIKLIYEGRLAECSQKTVV